MVNRRIPTPLSEEADAPGNRVMRRTALILWLVLQTLWPKMAAALTPYAQVEIEHLLAYVEYSKCTFYRNGSWYDAATAGRHLRLKYDWMKGSLDRTEEFIEKAASRSSLSGTPYEVRCGTESPVYGAEWLNEELTRFRAVEHHSSESDARRPAGTDYAQRRPRP